MICSEFFELLDNYESLTDEQRIEMEKHTAECETCRKELEFFKSVMQISASIPSPKPPESLIDKVNTKLDAEKTMVVGFRWNFRVLSTVAACLAIGLAVGINSGYIKDIVTDKGTDGVITETVVTTPAPGGLNTHQTEEEKPQTEPAQESHESESEQKADVVVKEDTKPEKPTATQVPQKAISTQKPVAKPQKSAQTIPVVTVKNDTDTKNTVNKPVNNDKVATPTVAPVSTPAPAPVSTPAPTVDNEPNVDDYAIKDESTQIAYGKYNVEVNKRTPNTFSDYLHVESNDMGTVVSTMSEMGVKNSGGYYMTSRQNFYALMDTLNDKGVGYECDLQYNSGDKISFRLTYN